LLAPILPQRRRRPVASPGVSSASIRRRVNEALESHLGEGERVLAAGFAWIASPRPKVPLLFLARRPRWVALTDRRLLAFRRPHRRATLDVEHLVLDESLAALTLTRTRSAQPMLQLTVGAPDDRTFVLEFRPRDRHVGRRIAAALSGSEPAAEPGAASA
jgi:hypothetical protein